MERVSAASASLAVRDKAVKVLQYGSRMLLHYWKDSGSPETLHRLQRMLRTAASSRKVFRLLKTLNELDAAFKLLRSAAQENEDAAESGLLPFIRHLQNMTLLSLREQLGVVRRVCMAAYFIFDNVAFLGKEKLLPPAALLHVSPPDATKQAWRFWLLANTLQVGLLVAKLMDLFARRQALLSASSSRRGGRPAPCLFVRLPGTTGTENALASAPYSAASAAAPGAPPPETTSTDGYVTAGSSPRGSAASREEMEAGDDDENEEEVETADVGEAEETASRDDDEEEEVLSSSPNDAIAALNVDIANTYLELIRAVCDWAVSANGAKLIQINDGIVGASGVVSAAIAVYKAV